MQFFIPLAEGDEQAERVYKAVAEFVHAPIAPVDERIFLLSWRHNGMDMRCEVGKPAPSYYQTGGELVIAIFDCGTVYKITTENRGVIRGEAILAGKDRHAAPEYFSRDE